MLCKARCLFPCLLALLLTGCFTTSPALAESGPFLLQRENSEEGEETEIAEATPEAINGEGGEQTLKGSIAKTEVEIKFKEVQIKGSLYDSKLHGQGKFVLHYYEPKLVNPKVAGCEVKIGENSTVNLHGYLSWKWNGE